jgi:hypothetical protein
MNETLKPAPVFAREDSTTVIEEIKPLLTEHYLEIAHYKDIELQVDYEGYLRLEKAGILRIFTTRLDGLLVGYAIFKVAYSTRYGKSLQAGQDVLYLAPDYRRGRWGIRFINWCDLQLKMEGVQVIYQHQKLAHPALGVVLQRLGYTPVDTLWAKRLD